LVDKRLLIDGYAIGEVVAMPTYTGPLGGLPDHLGKALNRRVETRRYGAYPDGLLGDMETQVQLAPVKDTVRDILTTCVPLNGYRRLVWEAVAEGGKKPVLVAYAGRAVTPEERILMSGGMEGFLREMGDRLDCYFTIEDRISAREGPKSSILEFDGLEVRDFEAKSIDELVASLNRALDPRMPSGEGTEQKEAVHVVRDTVFPRVVHLVRHGLLDDEEYVLNARTDLEFKGPLSGLPDHLGHSLAGRIRSYNQAPQLGGVLPYVDVSLKSLSVREALTGSSPFDGARRLLWRAARQSTDGSQVVYVGFYGATAETADSLGYNKLAPAATSSSDPFARPNDE
jgi:hypothetical protein